MSINEIQEKLEAAGCEVALSGPRLYVNKTPNGARGRYGYCVAGEDVRDIVDGTTKRTGEIAAILRR